MNQYVYPIADAFEGALRVEVCSDHPDKVWSAMQKLAALALDSDVGDVMVTIHSIPAPPAVGPHDDGSECHC